MPDQMDLFGAPPAPARAWPPGFRYEPDVVPPAMEDALLREVRALPFRDFEFQDYTGKRRVVSFGWRYDFEARRLEQASDIPGFLLDVREHAARFAGLDPSQLQQVLVTEYGPGAGIGWHRDKAVFGDVIGISLLGACTFRLRRATDGGWERVNLVAEPRSAYLLRGESRTAWEHSIPPVDALRYSITWRNLRAP
jgi:alkylated DNA repair dioxygenase AlkB